MLQYKIENLINSLDYENVKFNGDISDLFNRFIENRISSDFAVNFILKEAEDAFFEKVDDLNPPIGLWRGEFWGKLIISACRVAKYKNNKKIKNIIEKSVFKIISTANDDGYIGSYKNPQMVLPCPEEDGLKIKGWFCDWCWNIWCRKYTLWGLLESYELLGDEKILNAAEKFTDQLINMLQKLNLHICETGTFKGVASGSILKPILILYRHTGNKKYLDFAISIADAFENEEVNCAKLIKHSLNMLPVHLWNIMESDDTADINAALSQKAYETMSCFDGILELYRITGNEKYLIATQNFWELIVKFELNPIMSVGFNDIFLFAHSQQDTASEPCDVIHFIRLTSELFKLTGNIKYIDMLELSFENAMLASINRDADWGARILRGNSWHNTAKAQCDLKYNHCCVNNIPRGMLNAAEMIAVSKGEDIYINLYTPCDISFANAKINIGEGYIQNQKLSIKVLANNETNIYLRIPSWSNISVINGVKTIKKGEYFKVTAKTGENVFQLEFDHSVKIIEPSIYLGNAKHLRVHSLSPFMKNNKLLTKTDTNPDIIPVEEKIRMMIGPIILAKSSQTGSDYNDMFMAESLHGKNYIYSARAVENANVRAAFEITYQKDGQENCFTVGDFAFASNLYKEEDFTIYM